MKKQILLSILLLLILTLSVSALGPQGQQWNGTQYLAPLTVLDNLTIATNILVINNTLMILTPTTIQTVNLSGIAKNIVRNVNNASNTSITSTLQNDLGYNFSMVLTSSNFNTTSNVSKNQGLLSLTAPQTMVFLNRYYYGFSWRVNPLNDSDLGIQQEIMYLAPDGTLTVNGSQVCTSLNGLCATNNITGIGTTNHISFWTNTTHLGNSNFYSNQLGTVGIVNSSDDFIFRINTTNGYSIIGKSTIGFQPNIPLMINENFNDPTNDINGNYVKVNPNISTNSSQNINVINAQIQDTSTGNQNGTRTALNGYIAYEGNGSIGNTNPLSPISGVVGSVENVNNGTIQLGVGTLGSINNDVNGNITLAIGSVGLVSNQGTGTIGTAIGLYIPSTVNDGGGIITYNFGLDIKDQSAIGSVRSDNIYSEGVSSRNIFEGFVGINTTTPSQLLSVNGNGNFSGLSSKIWINNSQVCTAANGFCNESLLIDALNSSKLNTTDQRFNETTLANNINTSANIKGLGFNITSELTALYNLLFLGISDQRFNESLRVDSLNSTKLNASDQRFNETAIINTLNSTKLNVTDQSFNETTFITNVNKTANIMNLGFFNSTVAVSKNASNIINNSQLNCANITGATSNLCTIIDTDTDQNNYTSNISFSGTTTKQLNLSRVGMINLSASFTDIDTFNTSAEMIAAVNGANVNITGNANMSSKPQVINYLTTDITSSTTPAFNATKISLTLLASSTYLVDCIITQKAAAVTTGVVLQENTTGSPTTVETTYESFSSATAMESFFGVSASSNLFADTGSSTVVSHSNLHSYVVTSGSASTYTVEMRTEVAASLVTITKGSYCQAYKVV